MSHHPIQRGFTFLEVLLAMALTAFISVLAYQGLSAAINSMESQELEASRMGNLQTAWYVIGKDLQQAIYREITDDEEDDLESFIAGTDDSKILMEFTRSGWDNPIEQTRSDLQRVRYVFNNRQLWREHWIYLDRIQKEPEKLLLLDNVKSIEVNFFSPQLSKYNGGEWVNEWPDTPLFDPPPKKQLNGNKEETYQLPNEEDLQSALPLAVKVIIDLEDWGKIERTYLLPESLE